MNSYLVQPMRYSCVLFVALLSGLLGCGETSPPKPFVEWIDPTDIQLSPTMHDSLPEDLITRIKKVHATFADVDESSLDKWIDDFKRDLDPESNIRIWEDMVVAYDSFCKNQDLQLETREEVFKVVLLRSMMPDNDVLSRLELEHITIDDVKSILAAYPGKAKPIEVIQTSQ